MEVPDPCPLVRRLTHATTRREVARGLAVAFAAPLAAWAAPAAARHKHCGAGETRCGKRCVRGTCCPGKRCGSNRQCQCVRTVEGGAFCAGGDKFICQQCANSAACGAGEACGRNRCSPDVDAICFPACAA